MRNSGRLRVHFDKPKTTEPINIFLFPFTCTKSLIISLLLVGLPYALIFSGKPTLAMIGTILFFVFIPLFLGFATYASNAEELPEYPQLKELIVLALRSIATILLNSLVFLILWFIVIVTRRPIVTGTPNVLLFGLSLVVGVLSLYLLPKSLILLGSGESIVSSAFSLRPAFQLKYFLRTLLNLAIGAALILVTGILTVIPRAGIILGYLAMLVATYYFIIFSLSFLAEAVE